MASSHETASRQIRAPPSATVGFSVAAAFAPGSWPSITCSKLFWKDSKIPRSTLLLAFAWRAMVWNIATHSKYARDHKKPALCNFCQCHKVWATLYESIWKILKPSETPQNHCMLQTANYGMLQPQESTTTSVQSKHLNGLAFCSEVCTIKLGQILVHLVPRVTSSALMNSKYHGKTMGHIEWFAITYNNIEWFQRQENENEFEHQRF